MRRNTAYSYHNGFMGDLMPNSTPLTIEQISQATRALSQRRPPYAAMLAFYETIFTSQEQAKSTIALAPIQLSPEALKIRQQENLPLVDISGFSIDDASSVHLLDRLCDLTANHGTEMKASATAVSTALANGELDPQDLFQSLLQGDDRFFQTTAKRIGADQETLAFLAYNSIQPSVEHAAAQLAAYLDREAVWSKGYCPICGSAPGLAILGEEGRREMCCSFCRHQWRAPRIFCAFCENTAVDELHYFFAEEESDLRVDGCDRCRRYLKCVDRRKASRPLYPPLEQIASLHLDIIAAEKGFRGGVELNIDQ
jgi:FdhE protein